MKKLLIAMSAAAMFSLCAKAESTALLGGMNFETGYSAGDHIATDSVDPVEQGQQNTNVLLLWAGDNGESEIVEADNNKYLKVDTTAELTRKTAELNASANPVDPVSITNADVTVSSKVQFTAADTEPDITTGDKLIVWAKAPDEEGGPRTTTNLMVTAKTAAGVVTNFVTDVLVDAETWYDLQIVAKAEGSGRTATSTFVVKIAKSESGQTPTAVTVDNAEATFYSLLEAGATGAQTIASIGFKGTGAVDDIVFAKSEAVVVPDVTVTVSITENYEVYLDPECMLPYTNAFTVVAGQDAVVYVLDDGNEYKVTCQGATVGTWDSVNHVWPVTYTTSASELNVNLAITVTEGGSGGGDDPEIVVPEGGTVADVIAAATSATGIEIANVTAANQVFIDNGKHEITVGETTVSIPAFYTASFDFGEDSTKIVLTLNDAALTTAGTMVEVSVDTAFGLKVSDSDEKLYYGLSSSATVNGTYDAPAAKALIKGTGEGLTLSAAKGEGASCFYKLYVTDVLPNE